MNAGIELGISWVKWALWQFRENADNSVEEMNEEKKLRELNRDSKSETCSMGMNWNRERY